VDYPAFHQSSDAGQGDEVLLWFRLTGQALLFEH
jgi:hypothetical protein